MNPKQTEPSSEKQQFQSRRDRRRAEGRMRLGPRAIRRMNEGHTRHLSPESLISGGSSHNMLRESNSTNTELPRYESFEERWKAEGRPSREQRDQVNDARNYLNLLHENVQNNLRNREDFKNNAFSDPSTRILSLVDKDGNMRIDPNEKHGAPVVDVTDDLDMHMDILDAYRHEVNRNNWDVVAELAEQKKLGDKIAEFETSDELAEEKTERHDREAKVGRFIGRIAADLVGALPLGARQHWLNQKTKALKVDDHTVSLNARRGKHSIPGVSAYSKEVMYRRAA